ncbi:MAG TPA: cytochrome P460 family protein [Geobacteraceae bacterium]|nr:cytochrome P460 family protein [Geobacteraceae bacterium]
MKKVVIFTMLTALLAVAGPSAAADKVSLPRGYERWEKSKEKVVNDKKSLFYGIHYICVDKKAMKAYQSGGVYPEGSRFVVVFYNIKDEGGKPTKGKKNMVVLMEKSKKQQETGGWLFAGFNADGKPSGVDPVKNCFECHLKEAKATDYVISKYADFK